MKTVSRQSIRSLLFLPVAMSLAASQSSCVPEKPAGKVRLVQFGGPKGYIEIKNLNWPMDLLGIRCVQEDGTERWVKKDALVWLEGLDFLGRYQGDKLGGSFAAIVHSEESKEMEDGKRKGRVVKIFAKDSLGTCEGTFEVPPTGVGICPGTSVLEPYCSHQRATEEIEILSGSEPWRMDHVYDFRGEASTFNRAAYRQRADIIQLVDQTGQLISNPSERVFPRTFVSWESIISGQTPTPIPPLYGRPGYTVKVAQVGPTYEGFQELTVVVNDNLWWNGSRRKKVLPKVKDRALWMLQIYDLSAPGPVADGQLKLDFVESNSQYLDNGSLESTMKVRFQLPPSSGASQNFALIANPVMYYSESDSQEKDQSQAIRFTLPASSVGTTGPADSTSSTGGSTTNTTTNPGPDTSPDTTGDGNTEALEGLCENDQGECIYVVNVREDGSIPGEQNYVAAFNCECRWSETPISRDASWSLAFHSKKPFQVERQGIEGICQNELATCSKRTGAEIAQLAGTHFTIPGLDSWIIAEAECDPPETSWCALTSFRDTAPKTTLKCDGTPGSSEINFDLTPSASPAHDLLAKCFEVTKQ